MDEESAEDLPAKRKKTRLGEMTTQIDPTPSSGFEDSRVDVPMLDKFINFRQHAQGGVFKKILYG